MTTTDRPLLGRRGSGLAVWGLRAVALGGVLFAVALPVHSLTMAGGSVPVSMVPGRVPPLHVPGLPSGITVSAAADAISLDVARLSPGLRLLTEAAGVVTALAVAAGAWWLAGVLRSVALGRPFERRNAARLLGLTGAVLVGGVLAPMLADLAGFTILDRRGLVDSDSPFVLTMLHVNFAPLLLALVVLGAAEAFRRGAALADDVEGLV
jgi:Protein of unknown function (DUF2975)